MARSRAIKDEFFDSRQLAKVCRDARLLFVSIWLQADHWGVLLNNPRKIMVEAFPYDDQDSPFAISETAFRQWLEDLFDLCFILRFEYRGRKYIYVRSWEDHQTIQHRGKQIHNAIIPPDDLAGIIKKLLDENQPPLPNLAPSGKQNGKPIPNESGSDRDRIRNGYGTKVREGKVTEGKLTEGEQSPGNSARGPISADETAAVHMLEKGGSLLKRFVEFLNKQKNQKILKKVWHDQRFRAPTIRSLALEFMNSEQDPDKEAVNDQEPESGKGRKD